MHDVERRLATLEAAREIEAVKGRYSAYCDDGYDPDGIVGLFVPDGTWQATGFGLQRGHAEIHRFFSEVSGEIPWAWHSIANPRIEVAPDGARATARWYSLVVCERAGRPTLMVGKYVDELVLAGGEWRFSAIDCTIERTVIVEGELVA